jgi:hypothetical protein
MAARKAKKVVRRKRVSQTQIAEVARLWRLGDQQLFGAMFPEVPRSSWYSKPPPRLPPGRFWAAEPTTQELFRNRKLGQLWRSVRSTFKAVCGSYCANRARFSGDSVNLACTVLDALMAFQWNFPAPITAVTVYAVRNGLMDNLCKCPDESW